MLESDQYFPPEEGQTPSLPSIHNTEIIVKEKDPRQKIEEETDEIELSVIPKYVDEGEEVQELIKTTMENYAELAKENDKTRRDWHREVDEIFDRYNAEINATKDEHLTTLRTHQYLLRTYIRGMLKTIKKNRSMLNKNKFSHIARYQSKLKEYNDMPTKRQIKIPPLITKTVKGTELSAEFGELKSSLKQTYVEKKKMAKASLLDEQAVIVASVPTGLKNLCKVACVGTHEAWVNGTDQTLTCVDIFGAVQGTVKTTCTLHPNDITMTRRGELVYTNSFKNTVSIVKHGKSETFVTTPENWHPQGICDTRNGDIVVSQVTSDFSKYKVVRYDGKTAEVKQEVEMDDKGSNIFTGGKYQIFMSENINEDICCSDRNAKSILAFNKIGTVQFRYDGKTSRIKKTFTPKQIVTDSKGQVLVTDYKNDCLHVLDQAGQFVRLVDIKGLDRPTGLGLDKEGRLWVTLYHSGEIKVIQYMK